MTIGGATATGAQTPKAPENPKLRKASQQLEGAFVQQMYKSMRDTVPDGGMFDGGSGEQMFTGMMDEHVAADTPLKWQHGLSEAIYRQMLGAMHQQQQRNPGVAGATAAATATAATSDVAASAPITAGTVGIK